MKTGFFGNFPLYMFNPMTEGAKLSGECLFKNKKLSSPVMKIEGRMFFGKMPAGKKTKKSTLMERFFIFGSFQDLYVQNRSKI